MQPESLEVCAFKMSENAHYVPTQIKDKLKFSEKINRCINNFGLKLLNQSSYLHA